MVQYTTNRRRWKQAVSARVNVSSVLVILLLDTLRLEGGALILWGAGVLFPLLCLSGALALLGLALLRLFRGGPWKHAALLALGLILPLAIFLGFFVLAGALGLGPVPS